MTHFEKLSFYSEGNLYGHPRVSEKIVPLIFYFFTFFFQQTHYGNNKTLKYL